MLEDLYRKHIEEIEDKDEDLKDDMQELEMKLNKLNLNKIK